MLAIETRTSVKRLVRTETWWKHAIHGNINIAISPCLMYIPPNTLKCTKKTLNRVKGSCGKLLCLSSSQYIIFFPGEDIRALFRAWQASGGNINKIIVKTRRAPDLHSHCTFVTGAPSMAGSRVPRKTITAVWHVDIARFCLQNNSNAW